MDFAASLIEWFATHGRQLPWRETRDPYAIWLSEVILQQTRTEQGMPYWQRFMARWPRVELLAAAREDDVLREWQGLGYYSRARHLHAAAQQIAAAGHFPNTPEGLRALKGVGSYTAAAIGSIAFGLPMVVVDGNVYRVLARHYGIATPINTGEGQREFATLAQQLLPPREASAYNQAIMDLGATVCTPRSPRCPVCPVAATCTALREGLIALLPVKLKKTRVQHRHLIYICIRAGGQTAIHRRGAGDIWQGLWEVYCAQENDPLIAQSIMLKSGVRHVLTHRIITADFMLLHAEQRPALPSDYIWVDNDAFDHYAKPRLMEIMMEILADTAAQ